MSSAYKPKHTGCFQFGLHGSSFSPLTSATQKERCKEGTRGWRSRLITQDSLTPESFWFVWKGQRWKWWALQHFPGLYRFSRPVNLVLYDYKTSRAPGPTVLLKHPIEDHCRSSQDGRVLHYFYCLEILLCEKECTSSICNIFIILLWNTPKILSINGNGLEKFCDIIYFLVLPNVKIFWENNYKYWLF